jgi:hypothetical protein
MGRELDLIQRFQEHLDRYRVYNDYFGPPEVSPVLFQCLGDNQNQEVVEVLGMVALAADRVAGGEP